MRSVRSAALAVLAGLLAPGALAEEGTTPAGPAEPLLPSPPTLPAAERVARAIDGGIRWLRGQTSASGSYGLIRGDVNYAGGKEIYGYPAGLTALAMFTLLKCGLPADDPVVQKGFEWLRRNQETPCSSYELSMVILALEARANPWKRESERERDARSRARRGGRLDLSVKLPAADAAWMRKLVADLLHRRQAGAGWRYAVAHPSSPRDYSSDAPLGSTTDMSSTQLALLALLASERCGLRQPDALYRSCLDWVIERQEKDGPRVARFDPMAKEGAPAGGVSAVAPLTDRARGWSYVAAPGKPWESEATGSMTACGLASLAIAAALLEDRGEKAYPGDLAARVDRAWWDGIAWLQERWTVKANPLSPYYHVYYLYCLERVADLRGLRLLGGHDWYTEGSSLLVDTQRPDGSWEDPGSHEPSELLTTCFALLFLNRSTPALTGE